MHRAELRPEAPWQLVVAAASLVVELVSLVVDAHDVHPTLLGVGLARRRLLGACHAFDCHLYTSAMSPRPRSFSTVLTVKVFSLPAPSMVTVHSSSASSSTQKSPQLLVVSV